MAGQIRIGTSGWMYPHWRNRFYPQKLPTKEWLAYYAEHFDTVEINSTFYHLGRPQTFDAWHAAAGRGFTFAVKCSRFVTHNLKLTRPKKPLARFFSRVRRLKTHLGPLLYQLPPGWRKNLPRLREFCAQLPRSLTHVMEFRDPGWLAEDVFAVLADHDVALCIHDLIPRHPRRMIGSLAYIRFHGAAGRYEGSYSRDQLRRWAGWMNQAASQGDCVYAYFNNDVAAHAIRNASTLRSLIGY